MFIIVALAAVGYYLYQKNQKAVAGSVPVVAGSATEALLTPNNGSSTPVPANVITTPTNKTVTPPFYQTQNATGTAEPSTSQTLNPANIVSLTGTHQSNSDLSTTVNEAVTNKAIVPINTTSLAPVGTALPVTELSSVSAEATATKDLGTPLNVVQVATFTPKPYQPPPVVTPSGIVYPPVPASAPIAVLKPVLIAPITPKQPTIETTVNKIVATAVVVKATTPKPPTTIVTRTNIFTPVNLRPKVL